MEPFVLKEAEALDWLRELVTAYEMAMTFDEENITLSEESPVIGMDWTPLALAGAEDAYFMVREAQKNGLITSGTDGIRIAFEFLDDDSHGLYRWLLDITHPMPLKLATLSEALPLLGEPEARGVPAAMAVLREAVTAANHLLTQLADHIAATRAADWDESPPHGSEQGRSGEDCR